MLNEMRSLNILEEIQLIHTSRIQIECFQEGALLHQRPNCLYFQIALTTYFDKDCQKLDHFEWHSLTFVFWLTGARNGTAVVTENNDASYIATGMSSQVHQFHIPGTGVFGEELYLFLNSDSRLILKYCYVNYTYLHDNFTYNAHK